MTMQPAPTGLFSKVYGFASARVAMAVLLAACSAITGRGEQTSGGGSVGAYCQRLSTLLKAGVAAQAISCINLVAGCSPQSVARCVRIALFSACADPGADASCARISELCANSIPTSVEECHGFLNGMTEAGRQAVLSCVAPDGGATCTQDLPGCVRAL